jgi:hypothetical protein
MNDTEQAQADSNSATAHALGRVEAAIEAIKSNVDRVLQNQIEHSASDERFFASFRSSLGEMRDRITRVELVADAVESHGEAILGLERRITDLDQHNQTTAAIEEANRRWTAAIIASGGAVVGAASLPIGKGIWKTLLAWLSK